jgi:hypothetical protein
MALKTNVLSLQQDIHNIKNNLLNQKKTWADAVKKKLLK